MMVIEHPQRMSDPKMVTRSDAGGTRMEHWSLFSSSGKDPLEPFTTVSFPVVKFNSSQKPFVAFGYVPKAEFWFIEMLARYRPLNPSSDAHRIDGGGPQSSPSFRLD
jgi:hypothetical protein